MTGALTEKFENSRKEGMVVQLAGERFVYETSVNSIKTDLFQEYASLHSNSNFTQAGLAMLALQGAVFSKESCENASSTISVGACEAYRLKAGSDIDTANAAYEKILRDVEADLTAFEGKLHEDPRIHNIMLVDYLVNTRVQYTKDSEVGTGTDDLWQDPRVTAMWLKGDCEDYAFLKLKLLQDLNIVGKDDAYAMHISDKKDQGHMTLVARGSDGEFYVFENWSLDKDDPESRIEAVAIPLNKYMEEEVDSIFAIFNGKELFVNELSKSNEGMKQLPPVISPTTLGPQM